MELENAVGTTIPINDDSATDIGRNLGLGFLLSSPDRTVSRRHLSLRPTAGPRVSFHVLGRNPIVVHEADTGAERIYKNSESGELSVGDELSLSLKNPSFLVLNWRSGEEQQQEDEEDVEKRRILDAVERRERRTLERRSAKRDEEEFDLGSEDLDLSEVDPVKEFGFLVKGHEFDQYPKGMAVDFKHWNWFLEEPRKNTDEDDGSDDDVTRSKGKRRAKKKDHGVDEDEEWTGESEEDKVIVVKGGSSKRPKYSTRSKGPKKPHKDVKARKDGVDNDDEDEEDETLGGFIVDEDEEEQEANEEESEEELEEEEEEDEDEEDDESD